MKTTINPISTNRALVFVALLTCLIIVSGCKKYITIDGPSTSVVTGDAFKDNSTAIQVVTGLFSNMCGSTGNGSYISTSILPELSADNLTLLDKNSYLLTDYYKNSLEAEYLTSDQDGTYWRFFYKQLYTVNTCIEHLVNNDDLSPAVAKRLLGESYFVRAFYYFYLINFYGEVPLQTTTDFEVNAKMAKSSPTAVYTQIEADLIAAEELLDQNYVGSNVIALTAERIRPNKAAVNALQARVYLYEKKYVEAEAAATKVISQSSYMLNDVEAVFLKNSTETIWSLPSVTVGYNTYEGSVFLLPSTGPNGNPFGGFPVFASNSLVQSFKPGDARKSSWLGMVTADNTDYYYPAKYKVPFVSGSREMTEYDIVLRVAEQYLIRAEARNEQGRTADAISDLNALRSKRRESGPGTVPNPLPAFATTLTQPQLRPLIFDERRFELFTEGAHRWFDLRRSGSVDQVMTEEVKEKGGTWASYKIYYPIPRFDVTTNPSMKQTTGYPN